MNSGLVDERMQDGSRLFVLLPATRGALRVLFHVFTLRGAWPAGFLPSPIDGSWIDFKWAGNKFSINDQFGD